MAILVVAPCLLHSSGPVAKGHAPLVSCGEHRRFGFFLLEKEGIQSRDARRTPKEEFVSDRFAGLDGLASN
jgi:hypothetical protein